MNHEQQFLDDARSGGYEICDDMSTGKVVKPMHRILLDKNAWMAVGKTRKIEGYESKCTDCFLAGFSAPTKCGMCTPKWKAKWHTFIDYISEGDDISTALSKIE